MLKKAVEKHGISHLLIFGDFNFPEIDWMNYLIKGSDISLPANLFDITQEIFLKQHVDFNARFREGNESSMLDLIFTNEDSLFHGPIRSDDQPPVPHIVSIFSIQRDPVFPS